MAIVRQHVFANERPAFERQFAAQPLVHAIHRIAVPDLVFVAGDERHAPLAERLIRTPRAYIVDRPNGEIVVGATVEDKGWDTSVTVDAVYTLLEAAWEVVPDARELEWVEAKARLRPGTPDNAPAIGRDAGGVIWATGHYRNGILLTPVTADLVAAAVAGEALPGWAAPADPRRFEKVPA